MEAILKHNSSRQNHQQHGQLRGPEAANQTQFTRTATRDTTNRKPYRTAAQKHVARADARLIDGRYVSSAPVSFSRQKRGAA